MINALFTVLRHVPLLCDYKVLIDTVRGLEVMSYLYSIAQLNMMEEFHVRRIAERKRAAYFAMHREMDQE
jgi:hypothetical protein